MGHLYVLETISTVDMNDDQLDELVKKVAKDIASKLHVFYKQL